MGADLLPDSEPSLANQTFVLVLYFAHGPSWTVGSGRCNRIGELMDAVRLSPEPTKSRERITLMSPLMSSFSKRRGAGRY